MVHQNDDEKQDDSLFAKHPRPAMRASSGRDNDDSDEDAKVDSSAFAKQPRPAMRANTGRDPDIDSKADDEVWLLLDLYTMSVVLIGIVVLSSRSKRN